MKRKVSRVIAFGLMLLGLVVASPPGRTQPLSALDAYRKLKYPPTKENADKGWEERVLVEFEIVNSTDLRALRAGLKDQNPFVRSIAARALGIRGDKVSADLLAELVKTDPEFMVRARAVESLGLLKMKPETIELAKKDSNWGVQWVATMAAGQIQSATDYAALVQKAYAAGITRDKLGIAKVGQPAPDFALSRATASPLSFRRS